MPDFYDIAIDQRRAVTQDDVDRWVTCVAAFGMVVTFLRKTDRPVPADLAVAVAQGKVGITDGFARFDGLLVESEQAREAVKKYLLQRTDTA